MEGMMGFERVASTVAAAAAGKADLAAALVASIPRQRVVNRIKRVLHDISGIPVARMTETSSLDQDLELNSLERVEAGMMLEDEFGIPLSDDEVDQACMSTIGGIADHLIEKRGV
jgi:acyl carrier protein